MGAEEKAFNLYSLIFQNSLLVQFTFQANSNQR